MTGPTRGERNNNPGNIDYHATTTWQGQLGVEDGVPHPRFVRFDCPENGIRAIARIILSYRRHGISSIRGIIDRWAPPAENVTTAYVEDVATRLGEDPNAEIDLDATALELLVTAIIIHENGRCLYPSETIAKAVASALGKTEATASA